MWDQNTDKMFLELREDAVLLFDRASLRLMYLNPAGKKLFPDTGAQTVYADLFDQERIARLIRTTRDSGKVCGDSLEQVPWFSDQAVIHTALAKWEEQEVVVLAIDRRSYGPPPEAMRMMRTVLASAYFTALRINLHTQRVSVICDKNPLMDTQAHFPSYIEVMKRYAESVVHPEDRAVFLSSFSVEQLHLFLEAGTAPTCTVRRLQGEEYRWASFTVADVDPNVVLLFGKDSNEQHLQQERSDRYRAELQDLSQRNSYILSSVSDIFRLMLHIDLKTGETVVCSMHPDLEGMFAYDAVYTYEQVAGKLIRLVHPADLAKIMPYSSMDTLLKAADHAADNRVSLEYRRIIPQADPDLSAKWTRSVISLVKFEHGIPTEAFYTVQDVDAQKRREILAHRAQESLLMQFNTLIRNRFLWFIDCDYSKQIASCVRIANQSVMPPMECPFGQFFERMIMPHCHPEDYKKVALALLPSAAEEIFRSGKHKVTVEYRHKAEDGWRYVRAEMYLQTDDLGVLHTMTYISDIDNEVRAQDHLTKAEHEQLILRRRFGMMIEDAFMQVCEIDIDADTISHYQRKNNNFIPVPNASPFSEYWGTYAERFIHPEQRGIFEKLFSYQEILRAAREHTQQIKQLFLFRPDENSAYIWCNIAMRFFRDENGKQHLMNYVENVDDEIRQRDAQLHALQNSQQQLQDRLREQESGRIRKVHHFMNLASNFQLGLNQIYAALDKIAPVAKEQTADQGMFRSMVSAYEHLSAMTQTAKDMLLLENNQLPLLKEPTSLPALLQMLRSRMEDTFCEKELQLISYANHVTQEIVICDSKRLAYVLDTVFLNVVRALPPRSVITLQLSELPARIGDEALYEFSLIVHGDRVSQNTASGSPATSGNGSGLGAAEEVFSTMNDPSSGHQDVYLSNRLVSMMHGNVEYVKLPENGAAIVLRVPFRYVQKQIVFPVRYYYGKRIFVWDSQKPAAMCTMEMLRETGMQSDWQADFDNVCANLRLANSENRPYDIIMIRQSELYKYQEDCFGAIRSLAPNTWIILLSDVPSLGHTQPTGARTIILKTPLFRSGLADILRKIADTGEQS